MIDQTTLSRLLGIRSKDKDLLSVLSTLGQSESSEAEETPHKWLEFKNSGVSVMFAEMEDHANAQESGQPDPSDFPVVAFHLHRNGHEGYAEFKGHLDGGVQFGDTPQQVESKLGTTGEHGGGGVSKVLKGRTIPRWIRYKHGSTFAHYQFDEGGTLELVTLALAAFMNA